MGGSSQEVTVGFRYYMTLLMGLCRGPVDEIVQIRVGELRAWPIPDRDITSVPGNTNAGALRRMLNALEAQNRPEKANALMAISEGPNGAGVAQMSSGFAFPMLADDINTMRQSGLTTINARNLFGGDKKEGGVEGSLQVAMGNPTQNITAALLAKKMTGVIPGFRGVVSLIFDGLICSLNPYPKKWSVRARRVLQGWDGPVWQPDLAVIWMRNNAIKGANGAHIIYECLTNRDWGRGLARNMIHEASFLQVAQALHAENFGLCLKWTRTTELDDFISIVIDHIGGSLYTDRETGQIGLKLMRGDYVVNDLPLFTYESGLLSVKQSKTSSRNAVANEVVVEYFDPMQNKKREARVHNLASQQSLGGKITIKRSYIGVATPELALRLAQRDLKASVRSLKQFTVQLDRRAWRMVPGDVFRISAPDLGIYTAIVRAGDVKEESSGNITAEVVIDVFGLSQNVFGDDQIGEWNEPDRSTTPPERRLIREANYGDLVQMIDPANLKELTPELGVIVTLAARPSNLALAYRVATSAPGLNRGIRGTGDFMPSVLTGTGVDDVQTVIPFTGGIDLGDVRIGMAVQMSNEVCRLEDIITEDGLSGTIVVARGCADTIPALMGFNEPIFFMDSNYLGVDLREYMQGERVSVQILPYSSTNQLTVNNAPTDLLEIYGRHSRPWPPGQVRVNGQPYRTRTAPVTGNIVLSWGHRNRKGIRDRLVSELEAGTFAEFGTTYRIRVLNAAGTEVIRNVPGLIPPAGSTGMSWTYTTAMAQEDGAGNPVRFELMTERIDGVAPDQVIEQSFYRHRIVVRR